MDGEAFESWVAGIDQETGKTKGRLRQDANALRYVEVTVNGPKTWSLAAALYPEVSAALDAAQNRGAGQILSFVAQHATTRVGPRGRQVQVPVEQIEAAVIRHYTSRAGDPHRHLHLQINARVWAEEKWRGLHSVGGVDTIEAINGIEPGPKLREVWDRRAWADARPDKAVPASGGQLAARWNAELRDLGYRDPTASVPVEVVQAGQINRDTAADWVISQLGAKRSPSLQCESSWPRTSPAAPSTGASRCSPLRMRPSTSGRSRQRMW